MLIIANIWLSIIGLTLCLMTMIMMTFNSLNLLYVF